MLKRSIMQSLCIAVAVLIGTDRYEVPIPPAGEPIPPIQRCVVESLKVDGVFLVQHGWCAWDTEQKMWIPLSLDLARSRVFGIRPIPE